MTKKSLYAALVSLGLVAGVGMTFAHYAAAESSTNTPVLASTEIVAITPTEIKVKEDTEINEKESGDKDDVGEKSDSRDNSEMSDANEAALTPAQKVAHDKAESMQESKNDGKDSETND